MPAGKSFNPYLAKFDQHRIDLIKRIINDEYNLSSPDDPAREQTISGNKKNIGHYKNLEELDKTVYVKKGLNVSRDTLIDIASLSEGEEIRIHNVVNSEKKKYRNKTNFKLMGRRTHVIRNFFTRNTNRNKKVLAIVGRGSSYTLNRAINFK